MFSLFQFFIPIPLNMKLTTIVTGLILLNPVVMFCQDTPGLLRRAASAGSILLDGNGGISTNPSVDQDCLTDLPENVMAWVKFKLFSWNTYNDLNHYARLVSAF
ncbi:hypothetical protein BD408DRAFT_113227 [Parasitella parasitica]|nr:hypothetical protein BD408DRAFT_113227 [Parasitella parasitica]